MQPPAASRPQFSAELTASLQGLGVTSAFEPGGADFSGIDGRHDLHVSGVFHKAYAETNEEGNTWLRRRPACPW